MWNYCAAQCENRFCSWKTHVSNLRASTCCFSSQDVMQRTFLKKIQQTEATAIVNKKVWFDSHLWSKRAMIVFFFFRDQIRISFLLLHLFGAFSQWSFTHWRKKKLTIWTQMMLIIYTCINQSHIKAWHCSSTEAQALLAPLRKVLMWVTAKTHWCRLVHQSIWVQTPSRCNNHGKTVNKLFVKSYEYFKILQSI